MRTIALALIALVCAMPALAVEVQLYDQFGNLMVDHEVTVLTDGVRTVLPASPTGTYDLELAPESKPTFYAYEDGRKFNPTQKFVPVDLQGPLQVVINEILPQATCAEAIPTAVPSVTPFDTTGATSDPFIGGTVCGSAAVGLGPGLYYSVVGTGNTMTASLCNDAGYDSLMAVICNDCDELLCVGGNDDASGCGLTSEISWISQAGAEYLVYVSGFDAGAFGGVDFGPGNLTMSDDGTPADATVSCIPPPPPTPMGACCNCLNAPYNCSVTSEEECAAINGNVEAGFLATSGLGYQGNDSACTELGIGTFDYVVNPGTPIPDGTAGDMPSNLPGGVADILVPDNFIVGDVNVDFITAHTWASDLQLTLISPAGTEVIMYSRHCNGVVAGPFNGADVIIDDEGGPAADTCIASVTIAGTMNTVDATGGNGNATGLLSEFDGEGSGGAWSLRVEDLFIGDTGNIDQFSLSFTEGVPVCPVIEVGATGPGDDDDEDEDGMTTLCHCPPGNPDNCHTITVGGNAAVSHLSNHTGDREGECGDDTGGNSLEAEGASHSTGSGLLDLGFNSVTPSAATSGARVERDGQRTR